MRHKGGHWKVHEECYCCVPKGASWADATSNSDKIKPVALAIIELSLCKNTQAVS